MRHFGIALLLSCTSLTALPTFANAQNTPADPAVSAGGVEEVVVTARRREEKLQDVPVAVTALNTAELTKQVVQDLTDLQSSVPGLNTGSNTSTGSRHAISLSLRGIRNVAVPIYSNEVIRNPRAMFDTIYDLDSIQVLKGPQGTLFGANSLSGAMLIATKKPVFNSFEGFVEGRVGNYAATGATIAVNIPLVEDKVALRIAGDFGKRDGYIKGPNYDYDADDHYSARVSLRVEPTDYLRNSTVYENYRFNAQQGGVVPIGYFPCSAAVGPLRNTTGSDCVYSTAAVAPFGLPTFANAFAAEVANGPYRTNQTKSYPQAITTNVVSNVTELDLGAPLGGFFGDMTFRSVLGYQQFNLSGRDSFGLVLDIVEQNRDEVERRKTGEFQVQGVGLDGKLNWVAGIYLSRFTNAFTALSLQNAPLNAAVPITNRSNGSEDQDAGYGQVTYKLTDTVSLTGGYRRTKTETTQVNRNRNTVAQRCTLTAGAPGVDFANCVRTDRSETTDTSYTLGADWKFAPNGLLYFVTRRGFNQGGFNPSSLTADTASFKPETLTDYEIGLKHTVMLGDVRVRGDLALFRNDYQDMQRRNILLVIANGAPTASPLIQNLASSRQTGVEFQFDAFVNDALTLHLGGSHLFEAKYTEFSIVTVANTPPVDLRGNKLGQAPEWTLIAGLDYKFPRIEGFAQPNLSVNYAYTSEVAFLDLHVLNNALSNVYPDNIQKGYGVVNAQLELDELFGSRAKLTLWAKNLGDEFYYTQKSGTFGYSEGTFGDPRRFGATLNYKF